MSRMGRHFSILISLHLYNARLSKCPKNEQSLSMSLHFFKLSSLVTLLVFLSACSNNSDNSGGSGPNLTLTRLDATTLNLYEVDDTLRIDYELVVSELDTPDVQVDFYIVHAESESGSSRASGVDIEESHYLASAEFSEIANGSYIDSIEVTIPQVDIYGKYWIVAIVDPNDEILESNEDDNHPNIDNENHVEGNFPALEIDIEPSPEHEFVFVSSYIDGGLVVLDSPDVHEGTGTNHSDVIGHVDAIYHGTVEATAELTAEILINNNYQSVQLWDSNSESYTDAQSIDFEYNGDEHFFGFDLALTDQQLSDLYDSYDESAELNTFTVRLTLTDTTSQGSEFDQNNNQVEISVPLYFFEQEDTVAATSNASSNVKSVKTNASSVTPAGFSNTGNQLSVDGSYDTSYGDASKFKVGVDLAGELKADLLDKSASVESGGSVDMWIFNAKNTIFGISFDGQAYLSGLNTGYESEMIIFNSTVFEDEYWNAQFSKTFEKSWEEERILAQARFTVGPIPVKVSAGIEGGIGFELELAYAQSELTAEGDIFSTNFGGFANGGVDLLIAEAGVTIEINIIENVLSLESSANLALLDDGEVDPRIEYSFELTDEIDVISGRFGLFADVWSVKWCKALFVPYPCGSRRTTYYLWLYQTPSVFAKEWTIYSKEGTVRL